jgi:hypothetical protein
MWRCLGHYQGGQLKGNLALSVCILDWVSCSIYLDRWDPLLVLHGDLSWVCGFGESESPYQRQDHHFLPKVYFPGQSTTYQWHSNYTLYICGELLKKQGPIFSVFQILNRNHMSSIFGFIPYTILNWNPPVLHCCSRWLEIIILSQHVSSCFKNL